MSQINVTGEQSQEYSIINNVDFPKSERIALVKSMTDRLNLTLDDVKNSAHQNRLESLSIIPSDLLPLEINLADGEKVTVMETNPVVTCYDGELPNPEGEILHLCLKKEGEELPEDFLPPRKSFTVTVETLEKILPSIIQELISQKMAGTSNDSFTCKKLNNKDTETQDKQISTASDGNMPSTRDDNIKVEAFKLETDNVIQREHNKTEVETSPDKVTENDIFPYSSKIQVLGVIDTGVVRDSGSEDGLHNSTEEENDSKEWIGKYSNATIIIDKELGNPSDFRSAFLRTPSPDPKNKTPDVRKSARTPKPKVRSPFKSWDDLKIRLPRRSRKGSTSKGTQGISKTTKETKIVKKMAQKSKSAVSKKD